MSEQSTLTQGDLFEEAISHLRHGVVIYDRDLIVVAMNSRARDLLRVTPDMFAVGEPFETLARLNAERGGYGGAGDIDQRVARRMARARSFESFSEDQRLFHGAHIEVFGRVLPSQHFMITYTDITRRVVAERSAHDNEERFRDFAESASDWFWECDAAHILTYFSPGFEVATGYQAENWIGRNRREFVQMLSANEPIYAEHLRVIDAHQEFRGFRYQYQRPDGSDAWVSVSGRPIFDGEGNFRGYRGASSDITEQVSLEASLHQNIENYRTLVQGAPLGIVISRGGVPLLLNQTLADILGYDTPDAILELGGLDLLYAPESLETMKEYRHGRGEGAAAIPERYEFIGVKRDGAHVWLETVVQPTFWLGERATLAFVIDVSDRKRHEEALSQARDAAERANMAKSEFLSSMSHELRTPLNAILGFGQLLQTDPIHPLSDSQRLSMDHIMKGGAHLLDLIEQVLDVSRIEQGKLALSIDLVDPGEVIDECLDFIDPQARQRGLALVRDGLPNDQLPVVVGDRVRLKQILLNLMSNAVKYNSTGSEVTVRCLVTTDDTVRVEVGDDGPGIARERHHEIFQPFNRLGMAAQGIDGTGIGLSISRQLVELMKGRMGFDSDQGEGATFWFELPIADPNSGDAKIESCSI